MFELAHGVDLYDYMYKVEEMEYSTDKSKLGDMVSEMVSKERRREFADNYDRAMNTISQLELHNAQPSVFTVYLWDKCKRIMDIGDGEGQFLSRIPKQPRCEQTYGLLFNFPGVIEHAKEFIAKENISDGRVTLICGDILQDAPQTKQVDTNNCEELICHFFTKTDDQSFRNLLLSSHKRWEVYCCEQRQS